MTWHKQWFTCVLAFNKSHGSFPWLVLFALSIVPPHPNIIAFFPWIKNPPASLGLKTTKMKSLLTVMSPDLGGRHAGCTFPFSKSSSLDSWKYWKFQKRKQFGCLCRECHQFENKCLFHQPTFMMAISFFFPFSGAQSGCLYSSSARHIFLPNICDCQAVLNWTYPDSKAPSISGNNPPNFSIVVF